MAIMNKLKFQNIPKTQNHNLFTLKSPILKIQLFQKLMGFIRMLNRREVVSEKLKELLEKFGMVMKTMLL